MSSDLLISRRITINEDHQAMEQALTLAAEAAKHSEVPVGAVVVFRRQLVGWGKNQPISNHDPSAHAEMQAIRMAATHLQNYRLPECELFVTLEPCAMCFGVIMHSRLKRVIFAAHDPKTGVCGSILSLHQQTNINHQTKFEGGLMALESTKILKDFFAARRQGNKGSKIG